MPVETSGGASYVGSGSSSGGVLGAAVAGGAIGGLLGDAFWGGRRGGVDAAVIGASGVAAIEQGVTNTVLLEGQHAQALQSTNNLNDITNRISDSQTAINANINNVERDMLKGFCGVDKSFGETNLLIVKSDYENQIRTLKSNHELSTQISDGFCKTNLNIERGNNALALQIERAECKSTAQHLEILNTIKETELKAENRRLAEKVERLESQADENRTRELIRGATSCLSDQVNASFSHLQCIFNKAVVGLLPATATVNPAASLISCGFPVRSC